MSKPIVFISYSHKDEEWKNRLTNHLRALDSIVATNELAEPACAHPVFCPHDAFDPCRILRLPLEEWNAGIIEDWLIDHSGLMQLQDFDARAVAEEVHASGKNGKPHYVDKELRRVLLENRS